ncbi:MAG TPA: hypothetical protein VGQ76_11400 [Thermoanaerobaculia bacterium]|jgi:hypothetical protein|nr:hypothetical protein [Thermoanaerobaculia bacterium]
MKIVAGLAFVITLAVPLSADPLGDVRTALGKLIAREPIRATYEVQRSIVSEGKFDNDKVSGKAVVELEGGGGEFRVVVPKSLLEQISREQEARAQNVEQQTPTVTALSQLDPVETSNAIDFAPTLLRMIHGAKVVSDAQSTFQGKPARALVLRLQDRIEKEDSGRVKISENRLTLWLGADLVPVGAEHLFNARFSVIIFKGESKQKKSWYFSQVADRLVRVRHESSEANSGMGQKANETVVAVVRVH